MTTVHINLQRSTADGRVASDRLVEWKPIARVIDPVGDIVVERAEFGAMTVDGELTVSVAPGFWLVRTDMFEVVLVPDSIEVVEFADLQRIERDSLTSEDELLIDAWMAAITQAVADSSAAAAVDAGLAEDARAAAVIAQGASELSAEASADSAVAANSSAGDAATFAGQALESAENSELSNLAAHEAQECAEAALFAICPIIIPGGDAILTATMVGGVWDPSTRLRVTDHADIEQAFEPASIEAFDGWSLATWTLTVAQVTALIGTLTTGSLTARITTGSGDLLRPVAAGRLSILSKWAGIRAAQTLGTIALGPPGPGIASAAIVDGGLVFTLDDATTIAPVTMPLTAILSEDGLAPGLFHMGIGATYALTSNGDLYDMTPLTSTLGVI